MLCPQCLILALIFRSYSKERKTGLKRNGCKYSQHLFESTFQLKTCFHSAKHTVRSLAASDSLEEPELKRARSDLSVAKDAPEGKFFHCRQM